MITIRKGDLVLNHKTWLFPAGETGVRIDWENYRFRDDPRELNIVARIQNANDLAELVMVVSALEEAGYFPKRLVLPYIPNGRQDRVCAQGDSFGLLAFARQIRALGFEYLTTFDPHSEATMGVFRALGIAVKAIDQTTIVGQFAELNARLQPNNPSDRPLFVSPDAGSNKKVSALAALYGHDQFIRADKLRDLSTGKIKETKVYVESDAIDQRDTICCDDLCDGGATFIGLAAALKAKGARRVELFVTHGIFSKGLDPLWDGGIDHVWVTNSYRTDVDKLTARSLERLTILKLEDTFRL